eukprot:GEZU01024705.1.p1 GENE.GEZU01024705.1~~GEZU01024705.1.p1  ORF type:complete len:158 (-),score=21.78 GEZU01024705.1:58-531(-)
MQPTLNREDDADSPTPTDLAYVNVREYKTKSVQRGDVILMKSPDDPDHRMTKRVIAIEGDQVCINKEARLHNKHLLEKKWITVPQGHMWVEGDNPAVSKDSNLFGPVPIGLVQGKVTRVLWPPRHFGPIEPKYDASRVRPASSTTTTTTDEEEDSTR